MFDRARTLFLAVVALERATAFAPTHFSGRRGFARSSSSSSRFVATTDVENDVDDALDEYSRCLRDTSSSRRRAERDEINEELLLSPSSTRRRDSPLVRTLGSVARRATAPLLNVAKRRVKKVVPGTLILVRSGESEFSKNFTFAGWSDPDLTDEGVREMEHAGRLLLEAGYEPDVIYTSRLKRAINSCWAIMQEINAPFLPIHKSWRLNERHYGALQGLGKKETAETFGADVVQRWRRSLRARPPPMKRDDAAHPLNNRKYADLKPEQIPNTESLLDCMTRTIPLWRVVENDLRQGNNVLVVGHAGTLRGLAKIIDDVGDKEIADVRFPKGIPFVYKFDENMSVVEPEDECPAQMIHARGAFLEKPGQLREVMSSTLALESNVPGTQDLQLPNVVKRMTSVENALLTLKAEKEMYRNGADGDGEVKSESGVSTATATLNPPTDSVVVGGTAVSTTSKVVVDRLTEDAEADETFEEASVSSATESTPASVSVDPSFQPAGNNDPVVVFVRHGRTPHNKLALFTGWEDPPLAKEGEEDARWAGRLLKKHGMEFDVVYTSWLYRAIQTAWFVMEESDQLWLPMVKSWRLNERHYGDLTGKSKKMVANIHGEAQLKKWRRGYKIRPPPVSSYSFHYPGNDSRRIKYVKDVRYSLTETFCRSVEDRKLSLHRKFPKCESLHDCMNRSIPFYTQRIVPEAVARGKRVLIASHENAIRGILMHLCDIPEESMNDLHLPNGVPLVYNVKRRCIGLLDEGTGEDPLEKYDFGDAAQYLFRPCEIGEDEDWYTAGPNSNAVAAR